VHAAKLTAIFNPLCALTSGNRLIRQNAVVTLPQPIPSLLAHQVFTGSRLWRRRFVPYVEPSSISVFRADPRKVA
jgi:hypothetical protein